MKKGYTLAELLLGAAEKDPMRTKLHPPAMKIAKRKDLPTAGVSCLFRRRGGGFLLCFGNHRMLVSPSDLRSLIAALQLVKRMDSFCLIRFEVVA